MSLHLAVDCRTLVGIPERHDGVSRSHLMSLPRRAIHPAATNVEGLCSTVNSTSHPLANHRFAAVAVIGNGQEPAEPVELGVVTIDRQAVSSEPLVWSIKPQRAIAPHVTRAHGITNAEVAGAPAFHEISTDVAAVLAGRGVVGHHVRPAYDLLRSALPGWQPQRAIDTYKLAALTFPSVITRALPELLRRAALSVPGVPGRAGHDALATALLFLSMIERFGMTVEQLFALAAPVPNGDGQ